MTSHAIHPLTFDQAYARGDAHPDLHPDHLRQTQHATYFASRGDRTEDAVVLHVCSRYSFRLESFVRQWIAEG